MAKTSGTGETRGFSVKGQSNLPLNQMYKLFFEIHLGANVYPIS